MATTVPSFTVHNAPFLHIFNIFKLSVDCGVEMCSFIDYSTLIIHSLIETTASMVSHVKENWSSRSQARGPSLDLSYMLCLLKTSASFCSPGSWTTSPPTLWTSIGCSEFSLSLSQSLWPEFACSLCRSQVCKDSAGSDEFRCRC